MGEPHGHTLHFHAHSPVHRLPAHVKLVALVAYVVLVVATPNHWFWAFGVHLAVLLGVVALSRVPVTHLLPRMLIETPFVVFALLVPFVSHGPRVEVLGLSVSEPGLLAAWGLLAKGTLGVLASLTLAATTETHHLVAGLRRLRVPGQLVDILGFMLRYVEVIAGEVRRMRLGLEARGFTARSPRHWLVLARSLGALFIRSYERGERVHLAMLSRGMKGSGTGAEVGTQPGRAA